MDECSIAGRKQAEPLPRDHGRADMKYCGPDVKAHRFLKIQKN